ncbi:MAG: hypothetical protein Q9170_005076 [Blastenia crenularia]
MSNFGDKRKRVNTPEESNKRRKTTPDVESALLAAFGLGDPQPQANAGLGSNPGPEAYTAAAAATAVPSQADEVEKLRSQLAETQRQLADANRRRTQPSHPPVPSSYETLGVPAPGPRHIDANRVSSPATKTPSSRAVPPPVNLSNKPKPSGSSFPAGRPVIGLNSPFQSPVSAYTAPPPSPARPTAWHTTVPSTGKRGPADRPNSHGRDGAVEDPPVRKRKLHHAQPATRNQPSLGADHPSSDGLDLQSLAPPTRPSATRFAANEAPVAPYNPYAPESFNPGDIFGHASTDPSAWKLLPTTSQPGDNLIFDQGYLNALNSSADRGVEYWTQAASASQDPQIPSSNDFNDDFLTQWPEQADFGSYGPAGGAQIGYEENPYLPSQHLDPHSTNPYLPSQPLGQHPVNPYMPSQNLGKHPRSEDHGSNAADKQMTKRQQRIQRRKEKGIDDGSDGKPPKKKGGLRFCLQSGMMCQVKGGNWVPAAYHNDRRGNLLRRADAVGSYRYKTCHGAHPDDRLAYHPMYRNVNMERRDGRPDILYQWEPSPKPDLHEPGYMVDPTDGKVLVDKNNHPIKDWPELPTVISGQASGMWMELWRRINPHITSPDIIARMPSVTQKKPHAKPMSLSVQAFGNRMRRDRVHLGMRAWEEREGSQPIAGLMKSVMPNRVLAEIQRSNSTGTWRDLTNDEADAILTANKGQGSALKRAGDKKLSEEVREARAAVNNPKTSYTLRMMKEEKERDDQEYAALLARGGRAPTFRGARLDHLAMILGAFPGGSGGVGQWLQDTAPGPRRENSDRPPTTHSGEESLLPPQRGESVDGSTLPELPHQDDTTLVNETDFLEDLFNPEESANTSNAKNTGKEPEDAHSGEAAFDPFSELLLIDYVFQLPGEMNEVEAIQSALQVSYAEYRVLARREPPISSDILNASYQDQWAELQESFCRQWVENHIGEHLDSLPLLTRRHDWYGSWDAWHEAFLAETKFVPLVAEVESRANGLEAQVDPNPESFEAGVAPTQTVHNAPNREVDSNATTSNEQPPLTPTSNAEDDFDRLIEDNQSAPLELGNLPNISTGWGNVMAANSLNLADFEAPDIGEHTQPLLPTTATTVAPETVSPPSIENGTPPAPSSPPADNATQLPTSAPPPPGEGQGEALFTADNGDTQFSDDKWLDELFDSEA